MDQANGYLIQIHQLQECQFHNKPKSKEQHMHMEHYYFIIILNAKIWFIEQIYIYQLKD